MPTLVEIGGATYPRQVNDIPIPPMQGVSLLPAFEGKTMTRDRPIFWQWAAGGAIRSGNLKAVFHGSRALENWELYDLSQAPNEMHDLAGKLPDKVGALRDQWVLWLQGVKAGRKE
jgi:arylsulfatase